MNMKVKNGDYALIHKQDYAEDGDIVVAIVNGDNEATLKRYKKLKQVKDYILELGVYQILTSNDEGFMEHVEREIEKIDHKIYQKYIIDK